MSRLIRHAASRPFVRAATVARADELSPRIRRIRLQVEGLVPGWVPGDKIKVNVAPGVHRSYTFSAVNPARGTVDVVGFIHGNGAGSAWVCNASKGQRLEFFGPKASLDVSFSGTAPVFLLGDETTLGLFAGLDAPSAQVEGIVELDAIDRPAVEALGLPVDVVYRASGQPGLALLRALDRRRGLSVGTRAVVSGHAPTVRAAVALLEKRGVTELRVKPYWAKR
ncbi:MAG: siderophore-interacting protein [Myxococcota bacterium]